MLLARVNRAQIDEQAILFDAGDDGGIGAAQRALQGHRVAVKGDERGRERLLRRAAAAEHGIAVDQRGLSERMRLDESRGAAAQLFPRLTDHPHDRQIGPAFKQQGAQRGLHHGHRHLVNTQGPEHWVAAQARDQLGTAREDAGLGTAEELVAAEGD